MTQRTRYETSKFAKKTKKQTKKKKWNWKQENDNKITKHDEEISVIKTKATVFLHPITNTRKIHPFSFSLMIGWYLSLFGCALLGEQLSWHRNILTNEQRNNKSVWFFLVSKSKENGFFIQWQMQKKKYTMLPFLWFFFGDVWVSFFFVDWVKSFLEEQKYFRTWSQIKAKTKTQKTRQFSKRLGEGLEKKGARTLCERQQFLHWHRKKKRRKLFFLNSIVVVGNKINMGCVCVYCPMWWLFQPNTSIFKSIQEQTEKILCQTYELFWCDFCIWNKYQSKIEKNWSKLRFL